MESTSPVTELDDFHTEFMTQWVREGYLNDDSIQRFLGWVQDWYWTNKEEILK